MEKNTTITVKEGTWNELSKRKKLGESMDDLINRICLEEPEQTEENLKDCIARQNNSLREKELKKRIENGI